MLYKIQDGYCVCRRLLEPICELYQHGTARATQLPPAKCAFRWSHANCLHLHFSTYFFAFFILKFRSLLWAFQITITMLKASTWNSCFRPCGLCKICFLFFSASLASALSYSPAGIWPPTHSWTFSATAMHSDENDRHLRAGCTTGLPSPPPTTYIFPTFHVCTSGGKADHQAPFSNALKNLLHICSNHFWSFCVLHFFVLRSKTKSWLSQMICDVDTVQSYQTA